MNCENCSKEMELQWVCENCGERMDRYNFLEPEDPDKVRIKELEAKLEEAKALLKKANEFYKLIIKENGPCDHSVGICWCGETGEQGIIEEFLSQFDSKPKSAEAEIDQTIRDKWIKKG